MDNRITIEDVYEIASEVCEEMITKFLKNLVKLVPDADSVVEDIQTQQYQELRQLRQNKLTEGVANRTPIKIKNNPDYIPDELGINDDDAFAAIAKKQPIGTNVQDWEAKNNFDNVLGAVDLQMDNNLTNLVNQSPME